MCVWTPGWGDMKRLSHVSWHAPAGPGEGSVHLAVLSLRSVSSGDSRVLKSLALSSLDPGSPGNGGWRPCCGGGSSERSKDS